MPDFARAPATLPPDERIYAIGDVHGCDGLLAALHAQIAADLGARPVGRATLVHLGDYVDRGPDSAAVLARIAGPPPAAGLRVVNLRGNHEDMMRAALADPPPAAQSWLANGGAATLACWGIGPDLPPRAWAARIDAWVHRTLAGLAPSHRAGGYLFVHAGVRPYVPLDRQDPNDLMWIREPFLSSDADFGAVVVHGHTPRPAPEERDNRIGIDTGAVAGGRLTAVVLEADRRAFLSVQ
jgi:serine/threonine protein phosphatase 1